MIRFADVLISSLLLVVAFPVFIILYVFGFLDTGKPLFIQNRIGKDGKVFVIYKFRTMKIDVPEMPTHFAEQKSITRYGSVLRFLKLDEIPQIWNVFIGNMSFVGPRPCLTTQLELIEMRKNAGILSYLPGVTGAAQIAGVDMSDITKLVSLEASYYSRLNLKKYFLCIFITILKFFSITLSQV